MIIRQPCAKGGTTQTGGMAWRFFSCETIPTLRRLVQKIKNGNALLQIHWRLSVVLRVMASTHHVDADKLEDYCRQTYLIILEFFPWMCLSESVHECLAHCHQLIRENDGIGLGNWSEQGSEGKLPIS